MLALVIGALGAWSIAVPYVGNAIGFDINVAAKLEVVDHVIPGVIAAITAMYAYRKLRAGATAETFPYLIAVGVSLLAGLWITATHIPLLVEASRKTVEWAPALWHSLPGMPIPVLAAVLFFTSPTPEAPPTT